MKPSYTPKETCEILGVGKTTLYKLVAQRELDTFKIGGSTRVTGESVHRVATYGTGRRAAREEINAPREAA